MINEPTEQELQDKEFKDILAQAIEVDGGEALPIEVDQQEVVQTSELLYPIISTGFEIIVPHWNVKQKESEALAEAYGALLDKYFPDAGNYFGAEIVALMATAMIVATRLNQPEKPTEKTAAVSGEELNKVDSKKEVPGFAKF